MKAWFKRMFLSLLFDREVRQEIIKALEFEKSIPFPPPEPNKYKQKYMDFGGSF